MRLSQEYAIFRFSPDTDSIRNLKTIDPQSKIGQTSDPRSSSPSTLQVSIFKSPSLSLYLQVSITQMVSDCDEQGSYANSNPIIQNYNRLNGLLLLIMSLKWQVTVIQQSTTSLFDVVQSVWEFGAVCFTVLLLKLAKYVNVQQKQQRMTPYLAQHGQNLGITLSKVSQILRGINRPQMVRARYQMKQKIET